MLTLNLRQKLFFALFACCSLVVAALVLTQRAALERNIKQFARADEMDRAELLAERLAEQYAVTGSWGFIEGRRRWSPPLLDPPKARSTGPLAAGQDDRRQDRTPPSGPPRGAAGALRGEHPGQPLWRRIALLDTNGRFVAGARKVSAGERLPVTVDGQVVGTLLLAPLSRLEDKLQIKLQRRQGRVLLFSGGLALLVALAGAAVLSRSFGAPLRELTAGTRAVAGGDYSARVRSKRRDELGQLARDFNAMAEGLDAARRARRRWVADIAHELRTPIAVLRGELDAIEDGLRQPDAAAISSLNEEVRRLGGLVDDLHQLAQADAGALSLRPTSMNVAAFLSDVELAWRPRFAEADIQLTFDAPAGQSVLADAARLRQIMDNLLENAVRYTAAGGRCQVTATRSAEHCVVNVSDSEPGVPQAALPHLFDRLYRVDGSRSRASGASGLGLSIVRSLVEAHGGRVSATASPYGGLSITLELPHGAGA